MKKVWILIVTITLALLLVFAGVQIYNRITNKNGDSRVTNDKADKDEENRYLTIVNGTGQILNEVHITVGEGTEIEQGYQKNPDETSFSVKIPKAYQEYDTFVITLIDRYELKYQKEVKDVPKSGRTEVTVTEEDYVEQDGDIWKKADKFFNGD